MVLQNNPSFHLQYLNYKLVLKKYALRTKHHEPEGNVTNLNNKQQTIYIY